jgi:hypothetical protein
MEWQQLVGLTLILGAIALPRLMRGRPPTNDHRRPTTDDHAMSGRAAD